MTCSATSMITDDCQSNMPSVPQARSNMWQLEPEENDEVTDTVGAKDEQPEDLDDLEAKMSNASMWDPPPKMIKATNKQSNVNNVQGSFEHDMEKRTSLTDEYAGADGAERAGRQRSLSTVHTKNPDEVPGQGYRRFSEPRTTATDEYFPDNNNRTSDGRGAINLSNTFKGVRTRNLGGKSVANDKNAEERVSVGRTETFDDYVGNPITFPFAAGNSSRERGASSAGKSAPTMSPFDVAPLKIGAKELSTPPNSAGRTHLVDDYLRNEERKLYPDSSSESSAASLSSSSSLSLSSSRFDNRSDTFGSVSLNVPNLSMLRGYDASINRCVNSTAGGIENDSRSLQSWASHGGGDDDDVRGSTNFDPSGTGTGLGFFSQLDCDPINLSFLSQDSFASWQSHFQGEMVPTVLPSCLESMNDGHQFLVSKD